MDVTKLPNLQEFQTSDSSKLFYRKYHAEARVNQIMILLHGISEDSRYLQPLASFISEHNLAHVITPDMRGYGEKAVQKGDLDYIGQLEEDIKDLIAVVKHQHPDSSIILAGHSAGGGTAIRFAASEYGKLVDKYLLLSPFIHFSSPTIKDSDASTANVGRLIRLMILNGFGYKKKNHLTVLESNKPEELRHGSETLALSYRLFMSRIPGNYKKALKKLPDDTLLLIGSDDEEFDASKFEPLLAKYSKTDVDVIEGVDHDGILSSPEAWEKIRTWME